MRRIAILTVAGALALTLAGGTHTTFARSGSGSGGGNSSAAHACQQGGYKNLIGTNGTTDTSFKNTGQCVSYAAHGGMLVSKAAAASCLNGGYAESVPAGSNTPFTSEAQCVAYVGNGGTVYPLGTLTVTLTPASNGSEVAQLAGSGLKAGSNVTYSATYSDSTTGSGTMANTVGSNGSYTDTFTVSCTQAPAQVTFTATTASGATLSTPASIHC